ncbi:MAG: hypothetical protein MJ196_06150 [Treponemataceae bacterium]|nr:hypothetical protein [Treponemataceae bacterium]
MEETAIAEEKGLKAKTISKAFKALASAGMVISAALKWAGILPGATIGEVCTLWAAFYAVGAGTIDANIIIDKFTKGV